MKRAERELWCVAGVLMVALLTSSCSAAQSVSDEPDTPFKLATFEAEGNEYFYRPVNLNTRVDEDVQVDTLPGAAVPNPLLPARALHQDPPHGFGRGREEMPPALPVGILRADQSNVGFVDQRRRLERMSGRFLRELLGGQEAQLLVEHRQKLIGGLQIAPPDSVAHTD